jgi:hypothetical protein
MTLVMQAKRPIQFHIPPHNQPKSKPKKSLKRIKLKRKHHKVVTKAASKAPKAASKAPKAASKAPKAASKAPIKLLSAEMYSLQAQWYAKLKSKGFEDIERWNSQAKDFSPLMNCKSLSAIAKGFTTEKQTYYRRLTNWLTHVKQYKPSKPIYMMAIKMHAEGVPMRAIVKRLPKPHRRSLKIIHDIIHHMVEVIRRWNKTNPKGLDFEADLMPPQS